MNKQNIEIPFRSSNIKKLNNRKNLIIEIDQKELELKYCVNVKLIFNLSGMTSVQSVPKVTSLQKYYLNRNYI